MTVVETTGEPLGARFVVNAAGVERRHGLGARRRRAASRLAAARPGLAARPRARAAVLEDRRRHPRRGHARRLRHAHDEPLRAGRPDRAQPRGPRRPRAPMPRRSTGSWSAARRLVPAIAPRPRDQGVRGQPAGGDPVYRVERDERVTNLVQAAAIRSTGVSSSPAVAELVRDLLAEAGAPSARTAATRSARWSRCRACSATRAPRSWCARSALRPGDLRLRAGDGGRDRGGVRDARRAAHARRRAQAHARDGRPLPGRLLHGRRLVPAARRYGGLRPDRGVAVTVAIVGAGVTGLACAAALGRSAVGGRPDPGLRRHARLSTTPTRGGWSRPPGRRRRRCTWARRPSPGTAPSWSRRPGRRPAHPCRLAGDRVRRAAAQPRRAAHRRRPHRTVSCRPRSPATWPRRASLVGRRPAIVGDGDWARGPSPHAARRRAPSAGARPEPARSRSTIRGGERVRRARLRRRPRVCDAVVLADGLVPLRNVDGAVVDGVRTVYAQPCDDPGRSPAPSRPAARGPRAALEMMAGA